MFEKKKIKEELKSLEDKLENESSWKDHQQINKDLKNKNYLTNFIRSVEEFSSSYKDTIELLEITDENENKDLYFELENELKIYEKKISSLYLETLLSGRADNKNALLEIHSGAGGVESQDWVEMLLRMYTRWADSRNFSISLIDKSVGEEAGLKSVNIKPWAFEDLI